MVMIHAVTRKGNRQIGFYPSLFFDKKDVLQKQHALD